MDVFAPTWFEALLAAVLLLHHAAERLLTAADRQPAERSRTPGEYVVLLVAGTVVTGLLRTENVAAAAAATVLVVAVDLAISTARSRGGPVTA